MIGRNEGGVPWCSEDQVFHYIVVTKIRVVGQSDGPVPLPAI